MVYKTGATASLPGRVALVLAAIFSLAASLAHAQVMRLPPTDTVEPAGPTAMLSSYDMPGTALPPLEASPPLEVGPPAEVNPPADATPVLPRDVRPGVFQKLLFEDAWLPRLGGDNGFGMNDVGLKMVLGLPCPTTDSPLVVTPGFGFHSLDGPDGIDLPPRLYDIYSEFRWLHHVTPTWGLDLAVTPGVYSDFEQSSGRAVRITGHAIVAWTATPTTMWVLGADYLDRTDVPFLPVAGVIWTPAKDSEFRLVFPEPKISRRVYWSGIQSDDIQDWVYVGGELGGGTWAIATPGGTDLLYYRDYRIFLGIERKAFGSISPRLEIGYVFGRKIQLADAGTDDLPHDTVMLRGGLRY